MASFLTPNFDVGQLRNLAKSQLPYLAQEIRHRIVEVLATHRGHLASSLGCVDLAVALHYYFQTPDDILIWDIGHQAYAHKILTGRNQAFDTLREKNGLKGFLSRDESPFDAFGAGHSSTSLSALLGFCVEAKQNHLSRKHIAVIGDAALVSGISMEALNQFSAQGCRSLIILNENDWSIEACVGSFAQFLKNASEDERSSYFGTYGFSYSFLENGNDPVALIEQFEQLDFSGKPHLMHIKTLKGKGLAPAEKDPLTWHSPPPYNPRTLELYPSKNPGHPKLQACVAQALERIMEDDIKVQVISPAMLYGSGLSNLEKKFPHRVFDVGIAEQHALTFAAGMAAAGLKPIIVIYSTFFQRGIDSFIHDIALQNLAVTVLIDRAGFVGPDGATHHGLFDLPLLQSVPNTELYFPLNVENLVQLLETIPDIQGPTVIRYPRERSRMIWHNDFLNKEQPCLDYNLVFDGNPEHLVISTGFIGHEVIEAIKNMDVRFLQLTKIKPFPWEGLESFLQIATSIAVLEEAYFSGSIYAQLLLKFSNKRTLSIHIPDVFVQQATRQEQLEEVGLTSHQIQEKLKIFFSN